MAERRPGDLPYAEDLAIIVGGPGGPAPDRLDGFKDDKSIVTCFGCHVLKRNVCRVHGDENIARAPTLDAITNHISNWVDTLSKDDARGCTKIFAFRHVRAQNDEVEDSEPDNVPWFLALLIYSAFNPKTQFFLRLGPRPGFDLNDAWFMGWPPDTPFDAFGAVGPSRMGGDWKALVQYETSDEFGSQLTCYGDSWELVDMPWTEIDGCTSLIDFRINGIGVPFVKKKKAAQKIQRVPASIYTANPFADAAAEVAA